jgi:hypothetical protein
LERLSKAFGINSSLTKYKKIRTKNCSRDEEEVSNISDPILEKTLSFLEKKEDSEDVVVEENRKKNRNMKNMQVLKEVSMFSTQESKKNENFFLNESVNDLSKQNLEEIVEMNEYPTTKNTLLYQLSFTNQEECYKDYSAKKKFSTMIPNSDQKLKNLKQSRRKFLPISNDIKYQIKADSIYNDSRTTLMICNIPNKYTKELMRETIDQKFMGMYDFFYLPIDFNNNCNVGYAFINFININHIWSFYLEFNDKKWPMFNSEKISKIKYARIQGKEEYIVHFENSSLMKKSVN